MNYFLNRVCHYSIYNVRQFIIGYLINIICNLQQVTKGYFATLFVTYQVTKSYFASLFVTSQVTEGYQVTFFVTYDKLQKVT